MMWLITNILLTIFIFLLMSHGCQSSLSADTVSCQNDNRTE